SHFTLFNYLKIRLLFERRFAHLEQLLTVMNQLRYYDFTDSYPFSCEEKNGTVLFNVDYRDFAFSVDVTMPISKAKLTTKVTEIEVIDRTVRIHGLAYLNGIPNLKLANPTIQIYLRHRKTNQRIFLETTQTPVYTFDTGLLKYHYGGFVASLSFDEHILNQGYDVCCTISIFNKPLRSYLGGLTNNVVLRAEPVFLQTKNGPIEFTPLTNARSRLAFYVRKLNGSTWYRKFVANIKAKLFSLRQIKNNKSLSRKRRFTLASAVVLEDFGRLIYGNKNIILIGEKVGTSANDNGYWFYKYCREVHGDQNCYFVIDKKSPDYHNVKKLGNCVQFYSFKHVMLSMFSKFVISSDNCNFLLPSTIKHLRRSKRIFIQHGVVLTGKVDHVYHASKDYAEWIVTTNPFESSIIRRHFGFGSNQILEYGLSRFDTFDSCTDKKQVFCSFTWRKNILTKEQLLASAYWERIQSLIHNRHLHAFLVKHNITFHLCLHPRTSQMLTEFTTEERASIQPQCANIKVINFNETDIRQEINQSSVILTDYSSIMFDFAYLKKPIINYLFQEQLALSEKHADELLPGFVCRNEKDVMLVLRRCFLKKRFELPAKKIDYFTHRDEKSSERLYHFIQQQLQKKSRNI
ncbi:MAG: CDP-glycerol glycerophosphotransferase family protein, partial [Bacilli bacterium]